MRAVPPAFGGIQGRIAEMGSPMSYKPIEDYAAVGDCRCLGLISREGSLDWLCLPRFDSPSVFGALLDATRGGRFSIRPVAPGPIKREYLENTNVLRTIFTTASGELSLTDFMPVGFPEDYQKNLWPERNLLRLAECLSGEVELEVYYEPRPQYGKKAARLHDRRGMGLRCLDRGLLLILLSGCPLTLRADRSAAYGRITLRQGERCDFSLSCADRNVAVIPPLHPEFLRDQLATTVDWWRQWAARCTYRGRYGKQVLRSLLVLKLLTFAPSGAVIAAPTCSLPEIIGGSRNWDYRYCWLRDAGMTIRAFLNLGYTLEAEAFLSWLLHSTRLSRPELRVLYSVYGEKDLEESEMDLEGYRASRPVRVGNAASEQLQLDVYGEVIEGAFDIAKTRRNFDRSARSMLRQFGMTVCRRWREPDRGIWEIRDRPRHNTHSKVMCWVALDRLIELHRKGFVKIPLERFAAEHEAIRAAIDKDGYSEGLRSYTSFFGGEEVDISLFMLPIYQYIEAADPRMLGTVRRIAETLGENGLYYRFPFGFDGIAEGEGTFAIAAFLAAEVLALRGDVPEARAAFEKALAYANDVGLFGEEIDAGTGAALGNFPQAYSHVGLINAASALADEDRTATPSNI